MTVFIALAAVLLVATVAFLAYALTRAPKNQASADRRTANLAIFRDQLQELESEQAAGALSAADFEQSRSELQRRLIEEVPTQAAMAAAPAIPGSRGVALVLAIVFPVLALGGYALLGNPRALDAEQVKPPQVTADQIDGMVNKLAARLKENPADAKGWVMLARSYKVLQRYADAAAAYAQGEALVRQDATLLADYAEVLALANDSKLQGKPRELIEAALKLDPNEPQALLLAGAEASDREDFAAAAAYWDRLVKQLPAGSEDAQQLAAAAAKAHELAGQMSKSTARTGVKPAGKLPAATPANADAAK